MQATGSDTEHAAAALGGGQAAGLVTGAAPRGSFAIGRRCACKLGAHVQPSLPAVNNIQPMCR